LNFSGYDWRPEPHGPHGESAFPGYYIGWPGTSQTFDLKLYTLLLVGAVLNTFAEWVTHILTLRGDRVGRVS
jgi:hypothetical protein